MIIDAWISGSVIILLGIIRLFPEADPNVTYYIGSKASWIKSTIETVNWFFPVDTLLWVLGIVIAFELLLLSSRILFWITSNVSLGVFKSPK